MRALAAPAVALARRGFVVSPFVAERVGQERAELQRDPLLSSTFLPHGIAVTAGTRLRRPLLAATLERYGREGAAFVNGAFAQAVEQTVRREGGVLTAQDIIQYRPVERAVLQANFQGYSIATASAPSAGGMIVLQSLLQYEALLARNIALPELSSSAFHALIDGWKHGFDDRARYVGDPGSQPSVILSLLEPARLAARHAGFLPERARSVVVSDPPRDHGTTHISVIDSEGMAVSLTTTVNLAFGARRAVAGMDVILNDEIDDFSLGTEANNFALAQSLPNALAPGRRPISSMSPVVVLRDGHPIACVGAGGGPRIATATTQLLIELLVHHRSPEAAIGAARVHHQGSPDVVQVEPEVTEDVRAGLRMRGYTVNEATGPLAVATIVMVGEQDHQRVLFAASDPRKLGGAPAGD
jgi:gamma-glutamyltranspeptidase/glutathione hydrolase